MSLSLSAFSIDQMDVGRSILGVLLIAAYVVVFAGVFLEKDSFSEHTKSAGWRILLWGLAAETLLSILLFVVDSDIGSRQETTIATLNRDAERERLERLKLEAKVAPRRLSADQVKVLTSALTGQSMQIGISFTISSDGEPMIFAQDIAEALHGAGQSVQFVGSWMSTGVEFGVLVPPSVDNRYDSLADALVQAGIDVRRKPVPSLSGSTPPFRIHVGSKPPAF
jgi:hypothetical protein